MPDAIVEPLRLTEAQKALITKAKKEVVDCRPRPDNQPKQEPTLRELANSLTPQQIKSLRIYVEATDSAYGFRNSGKAEAGVNATAIGRATGRTDGIFSPEIPREAARKDKERKDAAKKILSSPGATEIHSYDQMVECRDGMIGSRNPLEIALHYRKQK